MKATTNSKIMPTEDLITWVPDGAVKIRIERSGVGSELPITVPHLMRAVAMESPDLPALKCRDIETGEEKTWTWSTYHQDVRTAAKAFIQLGLKRFESVCIMGMNSPEWAIANLAAIFAGGLATGVYPTNGTEACKFIMEQSNCGILVVEDQKQLDKIWSIRKDLPNIKQIIQWTGIPKNEGVISWQVLMSIGAAATIQPRGASSASVQDTDLDERLGLLCANQCCTLVFTSGTTGIPKGVMLSHDNITFNAKLGTETIKMEYNNTRVLSYLPLSHVAANLMDIHGVMRMQGTTYFADKNALKISLVDNMKWCKPTIFFGVPRVWEKIMEKMLMVSSTIPGEMVKKILGLDECSFFASGAAPNEKKTADYYLGLGIDIQDLYGMSETSSVHSMSTKENNKKSSVGKALPSYQSKLVQDRDVIMGEAKELWMWGRHVMMGYIGREDATKRDMTEDGWMKSGDLFSIDEEGFHYIVGRQKDLIITAGGENVAPQPIHENVKNELPGLVSQVLLLGDKQKFLSCFLTLAVDVDMETLEPTNQLSAAAKSWCRNIGSDAETVDDIIDGQDMVVIKAIQAGIDEANQVAVSNAQKIQKWMILPTDFSLPGGELTPTMKVKRKTITEKYKHCIEKLYDIRVKNVKPVGYVQYKDAFTKDIQEIINNLPVTLQSNPASDAKSIN